MEYNPNKPVAWDNFAIEVEYFKGLDDSTMYHKRFASWQVALGWMFQHSDEYEITGWAGDKEHMDKLQETLDKI